MYLSFYGLQKKPFEVSTDPNFLWLGEKHKEALATLKYGNLGNQGIILLTGDVGTGKTTLINALINSLGDEVLVAKVPDPGMEVIDFMNYISFAFGMKKKFVSKDAFLIDFDHFLNSSHAAGKKNVLIIDEAQRLSPALLEEVRQLSNIERQETKLLSIFFVGQNEFNDVLSEHKNRALRQRISLNYVIESLDLHETGEFIRHRLRIAGAAEDIFSPDAIRYVHDLSGGFPRRINIICDHSLLMGFAEDAKTVTSEIVRECAKDLLLPVLSNSRNNESVQAVDTTESENSEAPLPGHRQKQNAHNALKIMSIVILMATIVFLATFSMYPQKYRDLFSIGNTNGVQFDSSERAINTLNANSDPEADRKAAPIPRVGISRETKVANGGDQEMLPVGDPTGEALKTVSVVSTDKKPDIPEKTSIAPDLARKGERRPEDETDRIVTSNFHNKQTDSSDLAKRNPSEKAARQKIQLVLSTDATEQSIKTTEPATAELASPHLVNLPDKTKSTDQFTGNQLVDKEKLALTIKKDRIPAPPPPAEAVEPVQSPEADEVANEKSENLDPEALIDWVIKKRSK